jgi:DNA-binding transcriptional LysR family regulator
MDSLQSMRVFVSVAQLSGFSAAARQLRLSTAAVTRHVAALEDRLGARLLERTTRRVRLSEAGRVYLERCLECLQAVEDAEAAVSNLTRTPQGTLRVSAPIDLQLHVARVVSGFLAAHPQVTVDLRLSNRSVDLVEDGFDLGIDIMRPVYSPYVARLLCSSPLAFWAAPSYLRAHGRPRRPDDLAGHRHLLYSEPRLRDEFVLRRGRRASRVKLTPTLISNSAQSLHTALLDGLGVVVMPHLFVAEFHRAGLIEPLLDDWVLEPAQFHMFYPARRFVPAKVRAFIESLRGHFGDPPPNPRSAALDLR